VLATTSTQGIGDGRMAARHLNQDETGLIDDQEKSQLPSSKTA
jgi:hypothetical protein